MFSYYYFKEHPEAVAPIAIAAIVILVLMGIFGAKFSREFDSKIDNGQIVLQGNPLGLNQTGHPLLSNLRVDQVPGANSIGSHPRIFGVTDCENFTFPKNATILYSAASAITSDITITTPSIAGDNIKICVPDGLKEIPVYLWAK